MNVICMSHNKNGIYEKGTYLLGVLIPMTLCIMYIRMSHNKNGIYEKGIISYFENGV